MRTSIAIIPARGGSKRIPRKNLHHFLGKPVIQYSIETALESGLFDKVIVSTDDDEIATMAQNLGAEIPFMRPASLADDYTITADVVVHALEWLLSNNFNYEYTCCIYPTAPFVTAKDLKDGLRILQSSEATTAFPVISFPSSIFRALTINDKNHLDMIWPEHRTTRSQDLPEAYHDAGQFYWCRTTPFLEEKQLFSTNSTPIVFARDKAVDLDTYEDWNIAERLFAAKSKDEEDAT